MIKISVTSNNNLNNIRHHVCETQ